jgi:hypothetical protein
VLQVAMNVKTMRRLYADDYKTNDAKDRRDVYPHFSGPEDRPVLLPRGGDMGGGTGCKYLLINGQNSTIRTRFEDLYATRIVTDTALFLARTFISMTSYLIPTGWPLLLLS